MQGWIIGGITYIVQVVEEAVVVVQVRIQHQRCESYRDGSGASVIILVSQEIVKWLQHHHFNK